MIQILDADSDRRVVLHLRLVIRLQIPEQFLILASWKIVYLREDDAFRAAGAKTIRG